ncbi:MAG: PIG-L family deacetylase [Planctomycetes bacterium]|nr:PIG-L family deacetylase [Planctomycetota bacterium]
MKVLCIAAHPDDEVLGCGATLARLVDEGHAVEVAILGEGVTSRAGLSAAEQRRALAQLHDAAAAASRALGLASAPRLLGLPDNRFDTLPLLDVVQRIEELVRASEPELVYTHHSGDLNVDHRVTAQAVTTALRPLAGRRALELRAFEIPSSSEWSFGTSGPAFRPQVFVEVEAALERKLAAMACYEGEAREFPHPRSARALRALADWRGAQAGLRAAEAFELIYRREAEETRA